MRVLFDPGAINFLRFLRLYTDDGGIRLVDNGIITNLSGLARRSSLALWSNVLFFSLDVLYLACTCITLLTKKAEVRLPNCDNSGDGCLLCHDFGRPKRREQISSSSNASHIHPRVSWALSHQGSTTALWLRTWLASVMEFQPGTSAVDSAGFGSPRMLTRASLLNNLTPSK
jgi:hypothetical protein